MTWLRQVLFIQGAGAGVHDEWDARMVDDLRRALGAGIEVRYPRMPHEDDPTAAAWGPVLRRELAALDDGAAVVGHSAGGTILLHTLAGEPPARAPDVIALISAPFVGEGGWPGEEFSLPADLGTRLPRGVPVHLFHGLGDEIVPASHAGLHAAAIPRARIHLLPGRDHQLNDDLTEVAEVIRGIPPRGRGDTGAARS